MAKRKEKHKQKFKEREGITLIALVITVIVLLILAGVTLATLTGDSGILSNAESAKLQTNHQSVAEYIKMKMSEYQIEKNVNAYANDFITFLNEGVEGSIVDDDGVINVKKLLSKKLSTGNGTENSDVYRIDENYVLKYYEKDGNEIILAYLEKKLSSEEENPNKIVNVLHIESEREIYVQTQSGEIKCLTGNNESCAVLGPMYLAGTLIETWNCDNEDIISTKEIESSNVANSYYIDDKGKLYVWGQLAYSLTGSYEKVCVNDIEGSALNGKKVESFNMFFAIDEEGKVYAWGDNSYGQLGNGTTEDITIPVCISDIESSALKGKIITNIQTDIDIQTSMSSFHTFAIDNQGKVYSWGGQNTYGQLGNGTTENNYIPICISDIENHTFNNKKITNISIHWSGRNNGNSTEAYVGFIDDQGKVYTSGFGEYGGLGTGAKTNSYVPVCISEIQESSLYGKKIIELNMESNNAIDENGNIHYWGSSQLLPVCKVYIEGTGLEYKNIIQKLKYSVDSYSYNVLVLDNQGKVYTALDDGTIICMNNTEGNAINGKNIVYIESNYNIGIALDDKGKVYTWGKNSYGQLGNGTTDRSDVPICISDIQQSVLNGKKIESIIAYNATIHALDNEGNVYAWGDSNCRELGIETTGNITMPICINDVENCALNNKKIKKVIRDGNGKNNTVVTIFLTEEGELYYTSCQYLGN